MNKNRDRHNGLPAHHPAQNGDRPMHMNRGDETTRDWSGAHQVGAHHNTDLAGNRKPKTPHEANTPHSQTALDHAAESGRCHAEVRSPDERSSTIIGA